MGWLGKFFGGTVGFAIGGPLGAVLGVTFGHALDRSNFKNLENIIDVSDHEQDQLTFFVAAFSMLAKLVKVDGIVSQKELKLIKKFIEKDLKLDGNGSRAAINIFNTALNSNQTFDAFALQFYRQFHTHPEMLELMIDIMLRVAVGDGCMSHKEEELIINAVNIFDLNKKYEELKSKYISSNESKYYSILGCNKNETEENLKSCYRKKVREYHPDKIAGKGLPDEFTKFAQKKFREIQEAWDYIKKEKKIR